VGGAEKGYGRRLHITPASPTRAEPRKSSVEGSGVVVMASKSDCIEIARLPRGPSDVENADCRSPVSTKLAVGEPVNGVSESDVNEALKAPVIDRLTERRSLIGPVREPSRSAINTDTGAGITAPTIAALRVADSRLVMIIEPGMSVATMMLAVPSTGSVNEIISALAGPTATSTSPTIMSGTAKATPGKAMPGRVRILLRSILRPEAWSPIEFM
jgi:hypothetical protein